MKYNKIFVVIAVVVLTLLNVYSIRIELLGLVIMGLGYALVFYLLYFKSEVYAFLCHMLFTSTTFELDDYVYVGGIGHRYSYFSLSIVYMLFSILIFYKVYKKYQALPKNFELEKLKKWLVIFLTSGLFLGFFFMALNDNGTFSSGVYPKPLINHAINYTTLLMVFLTTIYLLRNPSLKNLLKDFCVDTLFGIAIAAIITSLLLGMTGYYGLLEHMMLAPMLSAFTPCLMCFGIDKFFSFPWRIVYLITGVSIIFVAFAYPSVVGSKWYLIILLSVLYVIYKSFLVKKTWIFFLIAIVGVYCLPQIAFSFAGESSDSEHFNSWKYEQVLGALDIFSYGSFYTWFMYLDESAQFRIEEPWNIAIEYQNKPYAALLGKGIGGTIKHHTNFNDWKAESAFNEDQTRHGFYYDMHESLAVIFLRHGFVGLFFFGLVLIKLIRRFNVSSFAVMAILWFTFYWSFCKSFRIGAIAMIIALSTQVFSMKNNNG